VCTSSPFVRQRCLFCHHHDRHLRAAAVAAVEELAAQGMWTRAMLTPRVQALYATSYFKHLCAPRGGNLSISTPTSRSVLHVLYGVC